MQITAKLYEHGRIAVSKPVRDALDVTPDDLVEIRVDGFTSTVPIRSTNRVTIPSQIRHELEMTEGDLIQLDIGLPQA